MELQFFIKYLENLVLKYNKLWKKNIGTISIGTFSKIEVLHFVLDCFRELLNDALKLCVLL